MRKANVHDYERFARDVLACVTDRPVSFEVFSDDFAEMERQAKLIASWASNVNVKIPVTNSAGLTSEHLMRRLASEGVPMNITAVTTLRQVEACAQSLRNGPASIISLFAGRVADTGRDPVPLMTRALQLIRPFNNLELLWASPREIFNVVQADAIGCDIITVTHELLSKLNRLGTDPAAVSLETVRMFADDARHSGYRL
jgi:transaldolase